jgi:DNA-binding CsgD family transcriptional regulator
VHRAELSRALLSRGDAGPAARVLADVRVPPGAPEGHLAFVHWGLGRLAAARGDDAAAAAAFDAGCALHHSYEPHAYTRWEGGGADRVQCYLRLGRVGDARESVALTLALAERSGLRGLQGIGLRLQGLIEGDPERLHEATALLSSSPMRLEYGHALLDLGAHVRRAGRRTEAREPLREALDIAHRCGAKPLAARAREELVLAGARPRRDAGSGRDSLTPAERRVADLIARGATNREIAQTLFITQKTAEGHTSRILRKLGVASRTDVAGAL